MRPFLGSLGLFALGAYAQTTSSYTDSNTGITFQRYEDTSGTGFSFGMAVPATIGSDFIGQIVMESNGSGYAGVSLTGEMVGSLLIVAWPNDDSVIASFRETSGYTSPGVYSNSSSIMSPISNGTFVNSTHMSYTFLCTDCITGDSYSFAATSTDTVIGWAVANSAVTNPSSASSASFLYHNAGFGEFGVSLSSAESADYSTWASMATVSNSSTSSTNTTCTSTSSNTTATVLNSTYDYIIAGAGPAGLIVAERLAESGKSVLLIEKGTDSYYSTGGDSVVAWNSTVTQYDVPSMSYYLTSASDTSEYCTDTANMAGCILGGGTMVNALMFVPPQEADFNDKWATGWKWDDVSTAAQNLYKRNPGTTLASKDGQRYDQSAYNTLSSFLDGLGWDHVDAIASPNSKTKAYSYPPWDIIDGLRGGPVRSYYPLAKAMSNFKLTIETSVVRAIRNGSTISGVEVEDSTGARQIININTGGKVILAAGAMSTPRILFNSGIGPTNQINIVKNGCSDVTLPSEANWINLPVGQNLKDHPIFTLLFNTTSNSTSMLASEFTSPNATDIDLFAQGSGPLVQSGQRLNFWTSLNTANGTRYFQGTCNSPAAGQVRIKLYLTHGLTSTGVLGITNQGATEFTTNPWLNTDADKAAATEMINYFLNAAKNSSVLSYSDSTATSESLLAGYVTGDHFVGTAQMSATNDGTGVVDTNTQVWGTDNLFVVDASMHPDLPTGNTQAIVMVAAERAAELILALSNSTTASASSNSSGNYTLPASLAAAKSTALVTSAQAAATDASSPTTLTVYATSMETIYSCAASITNCPARSSASGLASVAIVSTHTVALDTTVVPVSEVSSATSATISRARENGHTGIGAITGSVTVTSAASVNTLAGSPSQVAGFSAVASADTLAESASQATASSAAASIGALAGSSSQVTGSTTLTVLATSVYTTISAEQTVTVTDTITIATTVVSIAEAESATSAAIAQASSTGVVGIGAIAAPSTTAIISSPVSSATSNSDTLVGSTTLTVLATSLYTTVSAEQTITVTNTITIATTIVSVAEAESATSAAIAQASSTGAVGIGAITASSTTAITSSPISSTISNVDTLIGSSSQTTGSTTLTVLATSLYTTVSAEKTVTVTSTIIIATTIVSIAEIESATSAAIAQASSTGAIGIGAITTPSISAAVSSPVSLSTISSADALAASSVQVTPFSIVNSLAVSSSQATAVPSANALTASSIQDTAVSSADALAATSSLATGSTTLTVLATSAYTTVSAEQTIVVTDTIVVATTVCPVTEAESATSAAISLASATGATGIAAIVVSSSTATSAAAALITSAPATASGTTTLTIYATSVHTVTSCAASITNCPAASATEVSVVTDTVVIATTVCPIAEAASATSAAIAQASATGATNIGAIQVAATPTATTLVASYTSISNASLSSALTAALGNTSSTSTETLPAGTSLQDILAWLVEYLKGMVN